MEKADNKTIKLKLLIEDYSSNSLSQVFSLVFRKTVINFKFYKTLLTIILIIGFAMISRASVFTSAREMSLPIAQAAIATADLNEDGIPDLIIGGDPIFPERSKIRVGLGFGNGNFAAWQEYEVGYNPNFVNSPFVEEIGVADFNNDGHLDVVVAHNNQRSQFSASVLLATVLFGDGRGNLRPAQGDWFFNNNEDSFVNTMHFSDLNADGLLDIILGTISGNHGQLWFMKNLGNNTFRIFGPRDVGAHVNGIGTAFINNDPHKDVIVSTRRGVVVLYMDGNFFSTSGADIVPMIDAREIIVKDFNVDGKADIAFSEFTSARIHVYIQNATGFPATPVIYETSLSFSRLKSYDVNRDGNDDLVVSDGLNGGIQIFYGNGTGGFEIGERINSAPVADLTIADFDLNGKTDIITANYDQTSDIQARVFLNSPNSIRYYTDFDGDTKSDLAVFRPSTATWWINFSRTSTVGASIFGFPTDKIVAGNYDGDNKADMAIYRNGVWFILQSSDGAVKIEYWGVSQDIPVPADYNNDGKMNVAVYRPAEGIWYIKKENSFEAVRWGINTDKPVPADYDGDGKSDIAVYRASTGTWWILQSSDSAVISQRFGLAEDKPVPADYDGDGKSDIAVYRSGVWYLLQSTNGFTSFQWGIASDVPAPSDYDGDGKTDAAVYRNGVWYILQSTSAIMIQQFGLGNDLPISSAFYQ